MEDRDVRSWRRRPDYSCTRQYGTKETNTNLCDTFRVKIDVGSLPPPGWTKIENNACARSSDISQKKKKNFHLILALKWNNCSLAARQGHAVVRLDIFEIKHHASIVIRWIDVSGRFKIKISSTDRRVAVDDANRISFCFSEPRQFANTAAYQSQRKFKIFYNCTN